MSSKTLLFETKTGEYSESPQFMHHIALKLVLQKSDAAAVSGQTVDTPTLSLAPATERRGPSAAVSRPAWFVTRGAVRSRGVGPDSIRTGLPKRTAVGRRPLAAVKIE